MGLFRRTPKGRHALGAAVTSIPSGPLRVAAPLAAAVQAAPAPAPEPVLVETAEPSVMSSIAELIASGDAWATDLEDFHALHTPVSEPPELSAPPAPVASAQTAPAPVADVPSAPAPLPPVQVAAPPTYVQPSPAAVQAVPVAPAPLPPVVQVPAPVAPPASQEPSARASLEAALADLLPPQESTADAYAPPSAPRVQLGFRDGSSASLDPDSEQALALELLAQSLTRRD